MFYVYIHIYIQYTLYTYLLVRFQCRRAVFRRVVLRARVEIARCIHLVIVGIYLHQSINLHLSPISYIPRYARVYLTYGHTDQQVYRRQGRPEGKYPLLSCIHGGVWTPFRFLIKCKCIFIIYTDKKTRCLLPNAINMMIIYTVRKLRS